MASTHCEAGATAGQNAAGISRSGSYGLCAGLWCGVGEGTVEFLPLVLRDS
jgi:hypothetical protein